MFLSHGKIVAVDTPLELTKRVGNSLLTLTFDGSHDPVKKYLSGEHLAYTFPREHVVEISLLEADIPKILFGFRKHRVWITNIDVSKPDLEDVFLMIAEENYA